MRVYINGAWYMMRITFNFYDSNARVGVSLHINAVSTKANNNFN